MEFSKRLKKLRLSKGLSQKELADMLNIGRTTVCGYEQGKIVPKQDGLLELSKIFNVSTDYLTGVSNNPKPINDSMSDVSYLLKTIHNVLLDNDNTKILYEGKQLSKNKISFIEQLIQQLQNNIDMLIQMDVNVTDTETTPDNYDRWDKTCIKVINQPTKESKNSTIVCSELADDFPKDISEKLSDKENEYKRKVEIVLQKQRNGEELTDDELDILFEQMSRECANSMTGTHPPTEENK